MARPKSNAGGWPSEKRSSEGSTADAHAASAAHATARRNARLSGECIIRSDARVAARSAGGGASSRDSPTTTSDADACVFERGDVALLPNGARMRFVSRPDVQFLYDEIFVDGAALDVHPSCAKCTFTAI